MNKYRIGELRPSQIMFSYGIGAIADLPHLAAMVMGLEDWQRQNTKVITEDRLLAAVQEQLGGQVQQLVSLPIPEETSQPFAQKTSNYQLNLEGIPVAPFPTWMVCPKCDLIAPITSGIFELKTPRNRHSEAAYYHINCTKSPIAPKVIPVRFLTACEKGHLDDFPWRYFVHRGNDDCKGSLRLIEPSVSGAVTDIVVKCDGCNMSRRMSDALGLSSKQNMPRCRGRHPHLRSFDDKCDRQMTTMLLGASNSWFSLSLSALSIPNTENKLEQYIDSYWQYLEEAESCETLKIPIKILQKQGKGYEFENYKIEEIWEAIAKRQQGNNQNTSQSATESTFTDLKTPEWLKFHSVTGIEDQGKDWRLKAIAPPVDFQEVISKVILVEKLREVRSLIGFTRIQSPGDFTDTGEVPKEYRARLSRRSPTWVPAMEVRGEGIFIEFNELALQKWEQQPAVKKQHIQVKEAHKNWLNQRNPELVDKISTPDMRYLLIHSFSHALMRQFALECGYNAASLRERIYAQVATSDRQAQAGLLIYTAAPDSEGTLGGLVHLGEAPRLNHHIRQALESIRICTSDPLCAEHDPADDKVSLHWAACHACLFSPETSCERGNKFLDRALLVPTFSKTDLAFF